MSDAHDCERCNGTGYVNIDGTEGHCLWCPEEKEVDAHDEAAKAIARHYVSEWDGDEEDVYANMKADIAAALRKAAADEREAIAVTLDGWAARHGPACDCEASVVVAGLAGGIRARAKGGATSVPASGIHERAEGHPKSCTCSYCEVGR